jgi:hypothetical protein
MPYESHYPLHAADLLRVRAELSPDRVGLLDVYTGSEYTYRELNERANRLAHWLRDLGVEKGDRVSILAQNSIHYVDLLYGLGKIGAILAPLNWRLTARELVYIAADCAPKVIVCGPEYAGLLAEMRREVEFPIVLRGLRCRRAGDRTGATAANWRRHLLYPLHVGHDRPTQGGHDFPPAGAVELYQYGYQLGADGRRRLAGDDADVSRWRAVHFPDTAVLRGRESTAGAVVR